MSNSFNYDNYKLNKKLKKYLAILTLILFTILFIFSFSGFKKDNGYFIFVEFNDACGLKEGTIVNFKGVKIGYVSRINIHLNKIVVLLSITKLSSLIPKNSIIEANQIGLFNDIVVNITPLESMQSIWMKSNPILSKECVHSPFICPNAYVKGYKGINYDDLIRATTRISQRFDDPRFFNLIYLFLRNSVNISDETAILLHNSSFLFHGIRDFMYLILLKYLC
uniref:Mce/MlaD domain-containing protein n=1 Tax=Pleurostichidium falkenbergii TaxID=121064 RepID=A0A4D6UXA7_9FLOR|nr:hypothetical protein [Pleurostichidium falkenbergii]QCH39615.1 hypothetical protein [Pleurostichidium falkenbergii]